MDRICHGVEIKTVSPGEGSAALGSVHRRGGPASVLVAAAAQAGDATLVAIASGVATASAAKRAEALVAAFDVRLSGGEPRVPNPVDGEVGGRPAALPAPPPADIGSVADDHSGGRRGLRRGSSCAAGPGRASLTPAQGLEGGDCRRTRPCPDRCAGHARVIDDSWDGGSPGPCHGSCAGVDRAPLDIWFYRGVSSIRSLIRSFR